ncbi:hypothetical protein FNV43_RR11438 [Rhamnella rubrinervis]|uniref:Dirigent protein n=1 Tax=Rhamnella rubrinervis TaxID=2594499 RepID=A0A8K0H604_9ROSA|nr:hypothetical protein FNV43_RR11438 [Rhamnella rubrinervis]
MSSSMFNNNSISISVSDEDSDELGRMRVRVRSRKRKKPGYRFKNELARRLVRKLVRYWTVLIFIAAAGLLLFEASRIGRKSSLVVRSEFIRNPNIVHSDHSSMNKLSLEKKSEGNLNRLDPTTRVVGGVRERCLKLLPPEELEHLDIPQRKESTSPVNKVVYISENDSPFLRGTTTQSGQHTEATRFNLFTGNQTLDQRDTSFKVNDTAAVHCGFYSKNGGFEVSKEDRNYMDSCQVVVSTCAFGGGDDLYQPIGMSEASLRKVCYVAFWDEITVASQQSAGHRIGDDGFIGKWRIVVVRDLPFSDQRLNGKIPKMLGHRLFPHAKYSIWVDSKSQFRRDPLGVLEVLLWRSNSVLAISEHGARSSVYDEAKAVVKKNKARPEEVEVQLTQYRHDGFPEDKRFNGKKALAEASVIVREHTPLTNMFMCLWFNEVVHFTSRDQLSFPYVLWRLKVLKDINMFPVCTRKDLVNSMGHLRKAKPLVIILALFSPSSHHSKPPPWVALSLYIQQPPYKAEPSRNTPPVVQSDAGAFIFRRTLTEGPKNTSRVVGKAQGFIIPVERFVHSAFNIIHLTFDTPEYAGSLSVQAKHVGQEDTEELTVVGGTGSFAFARGVAVFGRQTTSDVDATYHVKLQLRFPNQSRHHVHSTIPG